MNYSDSVKYLYNLQKHGIKFGLDNTKRMLSAFGNPQNNFSSVHVAGTNGKGSTSAITASILQAAGFKTGLFTSPHLVSFTERIRVNSNEISEYDVIRLTDEIRMKVESLKLKKGDSRFDEFEPTFFEFVTAMGFLYFMRNNVDWAVIETGMGGRLDATNTVMPAVSIITGISLDHREFLGSTLSEIAREKAGIIKDGIPVVSASQEAAALDVVEARAAEKGSKAYIYGRDFSADMKSCDTHGCVFDYRGRSDFNGLKLSLSGKHQIVNASLALKAVEILAENNAYCSERITPDAIRHGLEHVRWEGRLELVSENPSVLIDGAHNPAAAAVLADSLRDNFLGRYKRIIIILGIMSDKDINGIMSPLLPVASDIILTAPPYERAASPQVLARYASEMGFSNIHTAPTVKEAIDMAVVKTGIGDLGLGTGKTNPQPLNPKTLIVITGSFYTIGEAKEALGKKGILSRLRETR